MNALKKINARAKAIRRAHPAMSYRAAQKKAGAEYRGGKKVSGVKRKKKKASRPLYRSSFAIGGRKKKKRVGGVSAVTKLRKAHEKEGLLLSQIGSVSVQRSRLRRGYEGALSMVLLALEKNPTASHKKSLLKKKAELKRRIRGLE
jgi:hypothetical protein